MSELKVGARLVSAVCTTEVVVVRVSNPNLELECGGEPMLPASAAPRVGAAPRPGLDGGSLIGKRYGGGDAPIEVLCVKAGDGTLAVNGTVLAQRSAKPLPASD